MDNTDNQLQLIYGDTTLGVVTPKRKYIFSYTHGGLESLLDNGKEWIYRVPKPAFWRATTSNDQGNHFSEKSAMWFGADFFSYCSNIEIAIDQKPIELPIAPLNNQYNGQCYAKTFEIMFTYTFTLPTTPSTYADIHYTVTTENELLVQTTFTGNDDLPQIPAFGIRMIMPTLATGFKYIGLSGETYPDRMDGGIYGEYEVTGLPVIPYLNPQECGMHMQTDQLTITRDTTLNNADNDVTPFMLTFNKISEPFAFSCLPYTPFELENAQHIEELPLPRRTVLTIYGKVRGGGGIDSWGADVDPDYQLSGQSNYTFSFFYKSITKVCF